MTVIIENPKPTFNISHLPPLLTPFSQDKTVISSHTPFSKHLAGAKPQKGTSHFKPNLKKKKKYETLVSSRFQIERALKNGRFQFSTGNRSCSSMHHRALVQCLPPSQLPASGRQESSLFPQIRRRFWSLHCRYLDFDVTG